MRKQTIRTRALRTLGACALSAALLLAAGCVEDLGLSPASGAGDRTLGIAMEGGMTKVTVDDGTTGALSWTTGDAIAVRVVGTGTNAYQTPTVNVTDKTVTVSLTGDQDINYYSVYPAASKVDAYYGNSELRVIYPATYTVPSGLAAAQQNLWSPMPMVAKNTDGGTPKTSLMFYHVGGVLRIKLTNVPTTATSCTVTFVGMDHVTGTYKVGNPGTTTANTDARVTGTNNVVTFNFAAGQATRWINVPLPTGDYSSLTAVTIAAKAGSTVLKSVTKEAKWYLMRHGQGRRLDADLNAGPGPLHHVNIGSTDDVTLWKGQSITRTAQACDNNGTVITGATITWASSNTTVATVDNTGKVTTNAAGTTTLTATASAGGVTKTASYKVYVNVLSGLTLDRSSMTLKAGTTGNLTATATYTTNGNFEVPQVNWSVTPAGRVTFAKTPTESGAANTIAGATQGDGTITARIPANTYGTHAAFTATCSIDVIPRNVIPGAFSVSPTEQVYFASGNLQVNYTGTSTGYTREWLFSENSWEYFHPTVDELNALPNLPAGTTVKLSFFGWGTAGHKNPAGNYGYNENNIYYEPHATLLSGYNTTTAAQFGPGGFSGSWLDDTERRLYGDWGIHFDDNGVGHDDKVDGTTWFLLSQAQWKYLLTERPGAAEKRAMAYVVIDPVAYVVLPALVIVPDDWQCPAGVSFDPENNGLTMPFNHTYYTDTTLPVLEASGAVVLCGEFRNINGNYSPQFRWWTSTAAGGTSAYQLLHISGSLTYTENSAWSYRPVGCPVRLARYAN